MWLSAARRDWLHVSDHCAALLRVLDRGTPGRSYNVGSTNEQSNLALVNLLCEVLEDVSPAADNPAMRAAVEAMLAALSSREQAVIRLRFGLDDGRHRTLDEVGREFGLSRERVRQIERGTLTKLRAPQLVA